MSDVDPKELLDIATRHCGEDPHTIILSGALQTAASALEARDAEVARLETELEEAKARLVAAEIDEMVRNAEPNLPASYLVEFHKRFGGPELDDAGLMAAISEACEEWETYKAAAGLAARAATEEVTP